MPSTRSGAAFSLARPAPDRVVSADRTVCIHSGFLCSPAVGSAGHSSWHADSGCVTVEATLVSHCPQAARSAMSTLRSARKVGLP